MTIIIKTIVVMFWCTDRNYSSVFIQCYVESEFIPNINASNIKTQKPVTAVEFEDPDLTVIAPSTVMSRSTNRDSKTIPAYSNGFTGIIGIKFTFNIRTNGGPITTIPLENAAEA
mmetsp:Transcript_51203/g.143188  ORF Transcript_51203/g.143188 Transcript_51203/m.143188 type:complete len:115 (-) Transcript_51203:907-1251(-)